MALMSLQLLVTCLLHDCTWRLKEAPAAATTIPAAAGSNWDRPPLHRNSLPTGLGKGERRIIWRKTQTHMQATTTTTDFNFCQINFLWKIPQLCQKIISLEAEIRSIYKYCQKGSKNKPVGIGKQEGEGSIAVLTSGGLIWLCDSVGPLLEELVDRSHQCRRILATIVALWAL